MIPSVCVAYSKVTQKGGGGNFKMGVFEDFEGEDVQESYCKKLKICWSI